MDELTACGNSVLVATIYFTNIFRPKGQIREIKVAHTAYKTQSFETLLQPWASAEEGPSPWPA